MTAPPTGPVDHHEWVDLYAWLDCVLGHCDLTKTQKLVLIGLATHTNVLGECARPGTRKLAHLCRIGFRATDGALAAGRRLGLIEQTARANPRRRLMAEYRLISQHPHQKAGGSAEPEQPRRQTCFNPNSHAH